MQFIIYKAKPFFSRTSSKWPFWNNTFEEYAAGFGDFPGGEGWLGLNWVHALSEVGGKLEMRIRLDGDMCVTKTKRSCSGFGEGGSWWGDWEFVVGCIRYFVITYFLFYYII